MSKYIVLDHNEASRETLLLDAYGKLHLARWSAVRPALGEVMHGPHPALGFHLLSAERSRRACAADMLLVDCQRAAVLARWAAQRLAAQVARVAQVSQVAQASQASQAARCSGARLPLPDPAARNLQRPKAPQQGRAPSPAAALPAPGV